MQQRQWSVWEKGMMAPIYRILSVGHIVAKAASHEGWVSARLDPAEGLKSLTPGSNIKQGFDHLRDRNLDLIRGHRDELERAAESPFPH